MSAAAWGMVRKVVGQHRIERFSSQSYLLMGWLPGLALCGFVPVSCFVWILLGGISYSAGTLFLMRDHKHPSFHPIWHLFVMLASACHFYAVYRFTIQAV